jgi:flagellar assembly protein FliH
MRNQSRFIPGEEIDAIAQWRFGNVNLDAAAQIHSESGEETARHDESVRQLGYAEGFVQGRAQAMIEAQHQINEFTQQQGQQAAQQWAKLFNATQAQLDTAEQLAAQAVLELACDLARQILRQEISSNPNALLPAIRESLGLLFADSRSIGIKLNPQDLEVLQPALKDEFPALSLSLMGDASLTRGGCLIESAGTVIDGRLEKRWARAIGQLGQDFALESGDVPE